METRTILVAVIGLAVGAILLGSMLPTALDSMYGVQTADSNQAHGFDSKGVAIATDLNVTNDGSTIAIVNLLPLFAVLGGLGVLATFVYKAY